MYPISLINKITKMMANYVMCRRKKRKQIAMEKYVFSIILNFDLYNSIEFPDHKNDYVLT